MYYHGGRRAQRTVRGHRLRRIDRGERDGDSASHPEPRSVLQLWSPRAPCEELQGEEETTRSVPTRRKPCSGQVVQKLPRDRTLCSGLSKISRGKWTADTATRSEPVARWTTARRRRKWRRQRRRQQIQARRTTGQQHAGGWISKTVSLLHAGRAADPNSHDRDNDRDDDNGFPHSGTLSGT